MPKPKSPKSPCYTRSKSKRKRGNNKKSQEDPHSTGTNAQSTRPQDSASLSPPQPRSLPPTKVNNPIEETVSKSSTKPKQVSTSIKTVYNSENSQVEVENNSPFQQPSSNSVGPRPAHPAMGDNRQVQGSSTEQGSSGSEKDKSEDSLQLVLAELVEIKVQMAKIVKLEASTESLAKQLLDVANRTSEIESIATTNAARLREVNDDLSTIKTCLGNQEKSIKSLQNIKKEVESSTAKSVAQMNSLVSEQQTQVESFKSCAKIIKKDILAEVEKSCCRIVKDEFMETVYKRIDKIENATHCKSFKDKAYNNRHNLVVLGLAEDEQKETIALAQDFFSNTMKISNVIVNDAYRIGSQPEGGSNYARPLVVKFNNLSHRNRVWRKRMTITGEDDSQKIRVLADVPKPLREGVKLMYNVLRAASGLEEYKHVMVRDYQLELNDKIFQFNELETLPVKLRPSTLASPRSEEALSFFTSASILSNHHPSRFTVKKDTFYSMEQFLALRKAQLSGKQELIDKASGARDPVQAKYVLNQLKNDHLPEWDNTVEEIAVEGLKAKFQENKEMRDFLCSTKNLKLGEASKNPRWGTGFELTDEGVLDHTKWSVTGNLLGRSLMKVREELCEACAK